MLSPDVINKFHGLLELKRQAGQHVVVIPGHEIDGGDDLRFDAGNFPCGMYKELVDSVLKMMHIQFGDAYYRICKRKISSAEREAEKLVFGQLIGRDIISTKELTVYEAQLIGMLSRQNNTIIEEVANAIFVLAEEKRNKNGKHKN